jgi:hypothetical protein
MHMSDVKIQCERPVRSEHMCTLLSYVDYAGESPPDAVRKVNANT